jgi:hypothetical protein
MDGTWIAILGIAGLVLAVMQLWALATIIGMGPRVERIAFKLDDIHEWMKKQQPPPS